MLFLLSRLDGERIDLQLEPTTSRWAVDLAARDCQTFIWRKGTRSYLRGVIF